MKDQFEYFYPVDFRNSGKDLIQNHLTFYLFHHTAIWPEKYWPKSIGVNGFVAVEGEKMSKSKGNVVYQTDISEKYGIDTARIFLMFVASPEKSMEWTDDGVEGAHRFMNRVFNLSQEKTIQDNPSLESKRNKIIKEVTEEIENFKYNLAVRRDFRIKILLTEIVVD